VKKSTTAKASSSKATNNANKRMNVSPKEARIVYARSGGVCAFPGCGEDLVKPGLDTNDPSFIGEIAHIVADSRQGPRGESLLSDEERDKHPNLVLLCRNCHKKIDDQPRIYSVSVLRQIKLDHEERVRTATKPDDLPPVVEMKMESILSSLLPMTHLPEAVFEAKCGFSDRQDALVKQHIIYPKDNTELVRFVIRKKKLFTFHDLRQPEGPFQSVIDVNSVCMRPSKKFWETAEGHRRFITLLNRAMYKHTALRDIRFDPVHQRYYFPVLEPGKEREVTYRPLNKATESRKVAWQPITQATGQPKGYWCHLAARLRFHRMANHQWCLSIRPERHLTIEGETPLPPEKIGRRVTRLKTNMFNDKYLSEVNFWRDVLSDGQPRLTMNFGSQSLVISTNFISFDVEWVGIPDDEMTFGNQFYDDDLFTLAELNRLMKGQLIDWDDDEEDEYECNTDSV
jgi:5-methylcytosine-specific restriction endonuclease McrA